MSDEFRMVATRDTSAKVRLPEENFYRTRSLKPGDEFYVGKVMRAVLTAKKEAQEGRPIGTVAKPPAKVVRAAKVATPTKKPVAATTTEKTTRKRAPRKKA